MAFLTTTGIISSLYTIFSALSKITLKQVKMFKGIKSIKCNDLVPIQKHTGSHLKNSNRLNSQLCQSCPKPLEIIYVRPKPVQVMLSQYDEYKLNGGLIAPITRYPGMAKKKFHPMASQWRLYAKEPDSPAPGKGGPVTTSGRGLGRLDAANERGFFHKVNKSRLEQIKQMLREKSLKKNEEAEKKEPK